MARRCSKTIVLSGIDTGRCEEDTITPTNPMCYWHRLDRTTLPGQARAAEMRLAAASQPHRPRVPVQEWPAGKRWCSGCQSFVPIWYCTGSRCKACSRAAQQESRRETIYGLRDDEWPQILKLQSGRCAICRNHSKDRAPAVEHDHGTSKVRGACCKPCNHDLLGAAHDSPRRLAAALVYLMAPPTSGRWVPPEVSVEPVLRAVGDVLDSLYQARAALAEASTIRIVELDDDPDDDDAGNPLDW